MKRFLLALLLMAGFALPAFASNTFYVRPDGGTRYTSTTGIGQCDGTGDAAYPGSGVNQHCAFNDPRFLWTDPQQYANQTWALQGCDTAIIRGSQEYLFTGSLDSSAQGKFGWGIGTNISPSPIPSCNTSGQYTTIEGENYAACSKADPTLPLQPGDTNVADVTKQANLWGTGAATWFFSVDQAKHVQVRCIDAYTHAACKPTGCENGNWAAEGLWSGNTVPQTTDDVVLQDVTFQGMRSRGMLGNVGGTWHVTRLEIAYNVEAGWDMDPGQGQASNGSIIGKYLHIDFSGCGREYPVTHSVPAQYCTDDLNLGYGDGIGTPIMFGLNFTCDYCSGQYNTQDAFDLGHLINGTISVGHALFAHNMAGTYKVGPMASSHIYDSIEITDCVAMSKPLAGARSDYNATLSDFCRAGDGSGSNVLTNALLLGSQATSSSGATLTVGSSSTYAVGMYVAPSNQNVSSSMRTVQSIPDSTHVVLSSAFPTAISSPTYILQIPGGAASSSSTVTMEHVDFIGYVGTLIDDQCMTGYNSTGTAAQLSVDGSFCNGAQLTFRNNLVKAYSTPDWMSGTPAGLLNGLPWTSSDYNVMTGLHGGCTPIGAHDQCAEPGLVNAPASPLTDGSGLEGMNLALLSNAAARGAASTAGGITADFLGNNFASPPSSGAIEYGGVFSLVSGVAQAAAALFSGFFLPLP